MHSVIYGSIIMHYRQLPEKIGHLYVGGYPQPFSTLDLKVTLIGVKKTLKNILHYREIKKLSNIMDA